MFTYIVKRMLSLLGSLFIVSIVIFLMMHSIPGGPFDEEKMPLSEASKARLAKQYGLDLPLHIQYLKYMGNALRLDFGIPYQSPGETINELLNRTWPISALLGGLGLAIAIPLGIILGMIAAVRRNSLIDYLTSIVSVSGITVPVYVTSMLLILVFAIWLDWFPAGGWGAPRHWVLPVIAYALFPTGVIARYTRASLLEELNKPFVMVLRSKGLSEFNVVVKHAFRNALIPLLTVIMPMFAGIMTGSIFVEQMFRVPGLGRFFVTSIFKRDYPLLMTLILIVTFLLGLTYLVTDILYCLVDPRIRLGGSERQ